MWSWNITEMKQRDYGDIPPKPLLKCGATPYLLRFDTAIIDRIIIEVLKFVKYQRTINIIGFQRGVY